MGCCTVPTVAPSYPSSRVTACLSAEHRARLYPAALTLYTLCPERQEVQQHDNTEACRTIRATATQLLVPIQQRRRVRCARQACSPPLCALISLYVQRTTALENR